MEVSGKMIRLAKPIVERFPRMAAAYRLVRDSRFIPEDARPTPLGFRFSGNPAMEQGAHESEEVEIVRGLLNEVDVFINIGANIGYYCCIALDLHKRTIAFEPIEMNLRYLYSNIRANAWEDHIEVFPIALGNRTGLIEIYGGGTGASLVEGWAGTPKRIRRWVPVSTLDTVLGNRLTGQRCFFLVDIEGSEMFMLEGASNHLQMKPKPVWLVEVSVREHQPSGISLNPHLLSTFQEFWRHGYESRMVNRGLVRVHEEDVLRICESGIDTFNSHNFLFTPCEGAQLFPK